MFQVGYSEGDGRGGDEGGGGDEGVEEEDEAVDRF